MLNWGRGGRGSELILGSGMENTIFRRLNKGGEANLCFTPPSPSVNERLVCAAIVLL